SIPVHLCKTGRMASLKKDTSNTSSFNSLFSNTGVLLIIGVRQKLWIRINGDLRNREDRSISAVRLMGQPTLRRVNPETDHIPPAMSFPSKFPAQFIKHPSESNRALVARLGNLIIGYEAVLIAAVLYQLSSRYLRFGRIGRECSCPHRRYERSRFLSRSHPQQALRFDQ